MINMSANLHNLNRDANIVVSVRFWPFLVVAVMWIYFLSRLQMHRGIGSYVIMIRLAALEFGKFLVFWLISITFFGSITVVWLGDFTDYDDFGKAIQSLVLVTIGLWEGPSDM